MGNYTVYHLHSDLSSGVTNIDSVTKYNDYVNRARELGMTALGFSEHGSVFSWYNKKKAIENEGMKYIHASEFYLTEKIDPENKIRDNYHCILIAKNEAGFHELNELSSKSFNREDGHFYYNPRISLEELYATSDNILITTACIGGVFKSKSKKVLNSFVKFLVKNKHRCFLEVQHHDAKEQIEHNILMAKLSRKYDIPLIAGTDTHALNDEHAEARIILQKSKKVYFEGEDEFDLTFKTYDELIDAYAFQAALSKEEYMTAIENTNVMADMIEPWKISRDAKYPKLYDDSEKVFKKKVNQGAKRRGILEEPNFDEYKKRVQYEYDTYKHNGAIDFMLLEEDYKTAMRAKGINCGYSRGSVSGSIIAYLLGITEIDSVKHDLNFERFMNTERISLADVDTDWYSKDREAVKNYLFKKKGLYCCDIITFNTIQLKGAIRDVARALEIPLNTVGQICDRVEEHEDELREEYPELFKYVDLVKGVIVSVGNHPAGLVVSPIEVESAFGTFYTSTNKYPISQINMKEIDDQNYVKLDILSLDNMGLIDKTCELAGIDRLTPNNTPGDDIAVWESIRDDTTCIFQWESDSAAHYLERLLSDSTIAKIRAVNPDFSYMDLLSIGNGAIRPAGASYREELATGEFRDNGHKALNDMLKSTLGFLVFQEQIIQFLHEFCGYTMGEADVVRRHFAKKSGTEDDIPKIKAGFISTMKDEYDVPKTEAEELIVNFIQVIVDASNYLFSLNHADPYSWIGYICGYLRYYYPLEFITTALNIFEDKEEKTLKITQYAQNQNIKIESIKFRYSLSEYTFSKENNTIYKGMSSIKYLNKKIGKELYELRDRDFKDFYELLEVIKRETSVNSRQLQILMELNFFSEFGNPDQLEAQNELFEKYYSRKQLSKSEIETDIETIRGVAASETDKLFKIDEPLKLIKALDNTAGIRTSIKNIFEYELNNLGYLQTVIPDADPGFAIVMDVAGKYSNKVVTLYRIVDGSTETVKVKGAKLKVQPLEKGQVIKTTDVSAEKKWRRGVDGKFYQIDEYENILTKWNEVK